LLYLPPYRPDLNPIEQVFAKIKALLRTAATRLVPAFWHEIGKSLDAFIPDEMYKLPQTPRIYSI
jgi:transposase